MASLNDDYFNLMMLNHVNNMTNSLNGTDEPLDRIHKRAYRTTRKYNDDFLVNLISSICVAEITQIINSIFNNK